MPEDEQGGGGQDGGQGGDQGDVQGGNQSDDPGQFDLGYQVRHRDPAGFTRKAAIESRETDPQDSTSAADPDDPGEFEVKDLTEEERRGPNP